MIFAFFFSKFKIWSLIEPRLPVLEVRLCSEVKIASLAFVGHSKNKTENQKRRKKKSFLFCVER